MKKTDKLTKKQVLSIPKLLKSKSMNKLAKEWEISPQAIYYWVGRLRKNGIEIITRKRGSKSIIL